METIMQALTEREKEVEDYSPRDQGLKPKLPDLLTRWVQIRLSDWIARQWEREGKEPFPNLDEIWRIMDLQEQW